MMDRGIRIDSDNELIILSDSILIELTTPDTFHQLKRESRR